MSDPFLIEGPAVISVSGGRTSGYMLRRILQAHGGKLPDDVRAIFANTGKEMGETLDFVQEMSERWGVEIVWLEYGGEERFRVVTYETSSRNGEPYEALIRAKKYLPNPVTRFCTSELKIRPMKRWCQDVMGWEHWDSALGFRADEPRRVAKLRMPHKEPFYRISPLANAGITAADVGAFWRSQPFDLRLPNMGGKTMHGNCDLCFLKGADQILSLIRERPRRAIWWMEQEAKIQSSGQATGEGARFRKDRPSYAQMYRMALDQGEMFSYDDEPLQDCMCVD